MVITINYFLIHIFKQKITVRKMNRIIYIYYRYVYRVPIYNMSNIAYIEEKIIKFLEDNNNRKYNNYTSSEIVK